MIGKWQQILTLPDTTVGRCKQVRWVARCCLTHSKLYFLPLRSMCVIRLQPCCNWSCDSSLAWQGYWLCNHCSLLAASDYVLWYVVVYIHPTNEHHQHRPEAGVSHPASVPPSLLWPSLWHFIKVIESLLP